MPDDRADAALRAFMIVMGCVTGVMVVVVIGACVVAPFCGYWDPDVALGFWLALLGAGYVIYRWIGRNIDSEKGT